MAVVTSTGRARARRHLDEAGLLHHFHDVVGGDEVPANKPDPAPYLEAARRLKVDPSRAAAFEDSDQGTAAAIAAGCVTVQIPDLRPPGRPMPRIGQHVAGDLRAAFDLLGLLP
jgi:HAD superfamily hydrolase (TIGR01509 family)